MLKIYSNFIGANQFMGEIKTNFPHLLNKPITVFNDIFNEDEVKFNPYNILMVMEPNQLFGIHDWAIQNHRMFDIILTWGQEVLDKCPNACFFPFGISWLDKEYVDNIDNIEKRFEVSFLCGGKKTVD